MKAVVLEENREFQLKTIEIPQPESDQIQVKIIASGFNPIDYQMIENSHERKLLHSSILGREFSGIVTKLGENASEFKIGDAVFCGSGSMGSNGTYAEYICVPEAIAVKKPNNISFEQAAGIPSVGLTALQAFKRIKVSLTDSILITGAAGGVGSFFIKLLIAKGFSNFVVTTGNEQSTASLLNLGVKQKQIINYKIEELYSAAWSLNGNKKFDIVVDLVGNKIAEIAAKLLKINGVYVDVTNFSTLESRNTLFSSGATIYNISNYAYGLEKRFDYYQNGLKELGQLIENESITPSCILVVGELGTTTVIKALKILRENKTQGKKLIMQVNKE